MLIRNGTVNFFKINSRQEEKITKLIDKYREIYELFENRRFSEIPNVIFDDSNDSDEEVQEVYYIQAMQKRTIEFMDHSNYYYWLMTISKVTIGEEIDIANVEREINDRRRSVDHGDSEGIVKDAWVIYDPFRSIMLTYSPRGTINTAELKKFNNKIIDTRGVMFEVILNEDGYRRIEALDSVKQLTYKIASPEQFTNFADENRTEKADLKFAEKMRSDELEIVLKADNLSKHDIIGKLRSLFEEDEVEVKKARVDGINDGFFEPIDLVRNKLAFKDEIEYEEEFDDAAAYGFLNKAYDKHHIYLKTTYSIRNNEGENDS